MASPSAETVARWRHPAALGLADTSGTSPDSPLGRRRTSALAIRTSTRSVSCLRDPSLLGRKQLVAQRIELRVCSARLADHFAPESRKGRSLPEPCRPQPFDIHCPVRLMDDRVTLFDPGDGQRGLEAPRIRQSMARNVKIAS